MEKQKVRKKYSKIFSVLTIWSTPLICKHKTTCKSTVIDRWNMRCGAPGEIRTPDTQIRSLVLYPAELRAHNYKINIFNNKCLYLLLLKLLI